MTIFLLTICGSLLPQWRSNSFRVACAVTFGFALSFCAPLSSAQTSAASEERIKAAFLYKFISYVEWPATAFAKGDSAYVIGIAGSGDISQELGTLAVGRQINNRAITIRPIRPGDALNGLHILFIGSGQSGWQNQLIKQMQGQPVLLVTDSDGAINQGSMINFRMVDDRVRFEVALGPIEQSGLKISSRMLAVALSVTKGTQ